MKRKRLRRAFLGALLALTSVTAVAEEKALDQSAKDQSAKTSDQPAKAPARASRLPYAWQALKKPAVPDVAQKDWVRTPVDSFILSAIEAKGLKPSPEADRRTFIRRAALDVWGLIPTPEEVNQFVNDKSPYAYEKLVDRLLASPRYGERQARRWLDLARYADSAGFQTDQTRPATWRYRDYVIKAFNEDKPYAQFLKEQIAGDEIAPGNQDVMVATGFLAGYPDNYNSRDLVARKYQITTDMTDTVGQAVLGTTVGCARCHDHKSDKFSQKDYFSLQAFFANTSEGQKFEAAKTEYEKRYDEQQAKYREATKEIRAKQAAIIEPIKDAAIKYHKERYLTDSRESLFKPAADWTPHDKWVNHRYENVTTNNDLTTYLREVADNKDSSGYKPEMAGKWEEYSKLTKELNAFNKLKPENGSDYYTSMYELGPESPPTFIFAGGNHERPLSEVQPAFPEALTDQAPIIVPTDKSSGRRTTLANWIASPKNPLTARVYVNRVWNEYFGKGIVATVSDFGKAGERPSNPELLDYLASNFIENGWSIKSLHREILLSATYRQASTYREDAHQADSENILLAVFPSKRLDAEQIRDSLLEAAGKLEEKIGGPSVFPPVPSNFNAGNLWEVSKDPHDYNRRSLYIFTRRSVPYPMLEPFDMANAQQVHSKRDVTTTPMQALTLLNNDVVYGWSQALAGRVIRDVGTDPLAQLDRLYEILFSRAPNDSEKALLLSFYVSHEKVIRDKATDGKLALAMPIGFKSGENFDPIRAAVFVDLVHVVANSNDFAYRF